MFTHSPIICQVPVTQEYKDKCTCSEPESKQTEQHLKTKHEEGARWWEKSALPGGEGHFTEEGIWELRPGGQGGGSFMEQSSPTMAGLGHSFGLAKTRMVSHPTSPNPVPSQYLKGTQPTSDE